MDSNEELKRLNASGSKSNDGRFFEVRIAARCNGNSSVVLGRAKDVLKIVIDGERSLDDRPDKWLELLPAWIIDACSPELEKKEIEVLSKTGQGREVVSNSWTAVGFLYCFQPEMRSWWWWDGEVIDSDNLYVRILVEGFPFAWENLKFLLLAAGADNVCES